MADEAFFLKDWSLAGVDPKFMAVYPESHSLLIGKDPDPTQGFTVVWRDLDDNLHAFRKLHLTTDGKLANTQAVELGRLAKWDVTIEQDPDDAARLKGTVKGPFDVREASLAGVWGAESPAPPFTGPFVQAPRLRKAPAGRRLVAPGGPLRAGSPSLLLP